MNGPEKVPADFPGTQGVPAELSGPEDENAERVVLWPGRGPEWEEEEDDAFVVVEGRTEEEDAVAGPDLRPEADFEVAEVSTGMLSIFPSSPDFLMSPPV